MCPERRSLRFAFVPSAVRGWGDDFELVHRSMLRFQTACFLTGASSTRTVNP